MIEKRMKNILRLSLVEVLKDHGFRQKSRLYVRHVDGIMHMVDVQGSQWNDREKKSITLNCGVYVPGVMSAFRTAPEPTQPKVAECCVSARVGMLRKPARDIWWEISESDSPDKDAQIAQEIASIVTGTVLPFLDRFRTELHVAEFLSTVPSEADKFVDPRVDGYRFSYAALIWRKLGAEEKCAAYIEQARQSSKKTTLESFVEAFAVRCKTSPDPG
jgi:hypothetical protein